MKNKLLFGFLMFLGIIVFSTASQVNASHLEFDSDYGNYNGYSQTESRYAPWHYTIDVPTCTVVPIANPRIITVSICIT